MGYMLKNGYKPYFLNKHYEFNLNVWTSVT